MIDLREDKQFRSYSRFENNELYYVAVQFKC